MVSQERIRVQGRLYDCKFFKGWTGCFIGTKSIYAHEKLACDVRYALMEGRDVAIGG